MPPPPRVRRAIAERFNGKQLPNLGNVLPFTPEPSPTHRGPVETDEFAHECPRCGDFKITGLLSDTLPVRIKQNPALETALPLHIQQANSAGEISEPDEVFIDEAFSRSAN